MFDRVLNTPLLDVKCLHFKTTCVLNYPAKILKFWQNTINFLKTFGKNKVLPKKGGRIKSLETIFQNNY